MTNDKDNKLFRELMKEVKPLKKDNKATINRAKPEAKPINLIQDQIDVVHDMLSDHYQDDPILLTGALEYYQSGIQKKTFKKLKQGKFTVEDIVDLHGLTIDKARDLINNFINHALQQQLKCVQIIHGKGYKSHEKGPVLKPLVNSWLRQKNDVLAFCSTLQREGGTGAVYVLLKTIKKLKNSN